MKKIFSRILAVGLLSAGIIGVSSCDYLDQKPDIYPCRNSYLALIDIGKPLIDIFFS